MTTIETAGVPPAATASYRMGLGLFAVAALGAAGFFWQGILHLGQAWSTAEYSHGPIIPVLSSVMFLREMRTVPPAHVAAPDRWPGIAVLAVALLLGLAGNLARIPDIVAYAMIVWIAGMVLIAFGWRRGLVFWPSVLHLVFMLPLPGVIYYKLTTNLQLFSSELGIALVQMAGVQAYLDGNIIDLGTYKLHVAEACSGLRYLFPIMSFSYVFAVLYRGPVWHKAVLLLSAAPITIVMNSVRIGIVGVMVEYFGIEHAEGFSHFMEGWVIFVVCVALLFGLARLMLVLQRSPMTLTDALDLDMDGLGPQLARMLRPERSAALAAAAMLMAGSALALHASPERTRVEIDREPLMFFPPQLGDWRSGPAHVLDPTVVDVLGADDHRGATYVARGARAPVDLFIAWYEDQTRGGIHSPEICLPGSGWEIAQINRIDVSGGLGLDEAFPVNRAVIQKGFDRVLVYYWFEQYGGRTAWDFAAKVALLIDGIRHGRTDGALVRLSTPIRPDESDADAQRRLDDLLGVMIGPMSRFVPRAGSPG